MTELESRIEAQQIITEQAELVTALLTGNAAVNQHILEAMLALAYSRGVIAGTRSAAETVGVAL